MPIRDREPWGRRRAPWTVAAAVVASAAIVAASPADDPPVVAAGPAARGKALNYSGTVKDKETGRPIAGATVTVRRSAYNSGNDGNRVIEETRHVTDAAGAYRFTIPPEQVAERALYVELDLEHPDYATRAGFGYALSMIRENETVGGRPFFEDLAMRPARPITGRLQAPDGAPARGVEILVYSPEDSFSRVKADDSGRFRIPLAATGPAVFWILPADLAPERHAVADGQRGDLGLFALKRGISLKGRVRDVEGKPVAGVYVNASRERPDDAILGQLKVADAIDRTGLTDADGAFALKPLPTGHYTIRPGERAREGDGNREIRPLAAVFLDRKLTLGDGDEPAPLEIRAVPHCTIEARWLDGGGKPTRGFAGHVAGTVGADYWHAPAHVAADGRVVVRAPRGMKQARLGIMTNEHGALLFRTAPGAPLRAGPAIPFGTLDRDIKGVEIVRFRAPILVVKGQTRDGKPVPGLIVAARYTPAVPGQDGFILPGDRESDVNFEAQEDGRHRTSHLLPDREVTITAEAQGFRPGTARVNLPEGTNRDLVLTLDPK